MIGAHDAVGSFAVDALEPAEVDTFLAHQAHCPTCRQDTLDFAETTAQLSLLAVAAPPPQLRASVLDEIRRIRPFPPLLTAPLPPTPLAGRRRTRADRSGNPSSHGLRPGGLTLDRTDAAGAGTLIGPSLDVPGSSAPTGAAAPTPGHDLSRWRRPSSTRRRAPILAAAALALITLGSLTGLVSTLQTSTAVQADSTRRAQLMAAPDARIVPTSFGGGRASVVSSATLDEALFVAPGLTAPSGDRVYQLWLIRDGRPIPDVVLAPAQTSAWLQGSVRGAEGAAVSLEPPGGSPDATPTTVVAQLSL